MQTLLHDLLDYSRVGNEADSMTKIDCQEILPQAIANLKAAIEESQARVTLTRYRPLLRTARK
jgi:light-regulated signal transduction histidine kinase (bacteriophytochrome)